MKRTQERVREDRRNTALPGAATSVLAPEDILRFQPAAGVSTRSPRRFRHLVGTEFPFEFDRGRPVLGDVIERDGLTAEYVKCDIPFADAVADDLYGAYNCESGSIIVLGCFPSTSVSARSYWTVLHHRIFLPGRDEPAHLGRSFDHEGTLQVWYEEIIRDIDPSTGEVLTWKAVVCGKQSRGILWTPRYCNQSARMDRTSRAAGSAASRARALGISIQIDRVDPHDIFERDNWTCRLCGAPIDPLKVYPHLDGASLDHIMPISLGGDHVASNLQASHLGCNIAKGDQADWSAAVH